MKNIVIIGATSAIAIATARRYASDGCCLYLIGRHEQKLIELQSDLMARGAEAVKFAVLDLSKIDQFQPVIMQVMQQFVTVDLALIAHGTLTKQDIAQNDVDYLQEEMSINAVSTMAIASLLANYMEKQKSGTLCVISSVAGDRGRQSNYIYGAAKSAVSTFCQGLRNRLYPHVNIITIKPGFVITPMTKAFKKGLLWVQPEVVANDIYRAVKNQRDVVYTPWFWRYIMLIIKMIPEKIFKRMSL